MGVGKHLLFQQQHLKFPWDLARPNPLLDIVFLLRFDDKLSVPHFSPRKSRR